MKNIDRLLFLPLFAALAIGCSSPTAMQSSEYDDVYFSSKDKTVITDNRVAERSSDISDQEQQEMDAVTNGNTLPNPEYSGTTSSTVAANEDYYSENYYDEDDYAYASRIRRFNAPYRGFSYYDPAYTDSYWYNRNPLYYGRSSMYYDPFYAYDPFFPCYTCYGYPAYYGGINISIGLPLYSRWGNPFGGYYGGYGYNRGFNNGFYNGFYSSYYANNGWYRNDTNGGRNVQYGRRRDRSEIPTGSNANTGSRPRGGITSGGGIVGGGNAGGGIARPSEGNTRSTRSRGGSNAGITSNEPTITRPTDTQGRTTRGRQDRSTTLTQPDGSTNLPVERAGRREIESTVTDMPNSRGRREINQPTVQPRSERSTETYTPAPQTERRQRREIQVQPREQQTQQRTYEAPQRQQQRTYEAPQRQQQRTYEAPQRQQQSTPSFGGGSNGGSSSGSRRRN